MAKTALVLSAGGSFGAYQVGVWKVLEQILQPRQQAGEAGHDEGVQRRGEAAAPVGGRRGGAEAGATGCRRGLMI